jgi:ATP-dependent exoDNAse (exonuclease V) beta subunit
MIDEFQDTNAMQYELASRIVRSLKDEKVEDHAANLYIVGDPKQSIYGFRLSGCARIRYGNQGYSTKQIL